MANGAGKASRGAIAQTVTRNRTASYPCLHGKAFASRLRILPQQPPGELLQSVSRVINQIAPEFSALFHKQI